MKLEYNRLKEGEKTFHNAMTSRLGHSMSSYGNHCRQKPSIFTYGGAKADMSRKQTII